MAEARAARRARRWRSIRTIASRTGFSGLIQASQCPDRAAPAPPRRSSRGHRASRARARRLAQDPVAQFTLGDLYLRNGQATEADRDAAAVPGGAAGVSAGDDVCWSERIATAGKPLRPTPDGRTAAARQCLGASPDCSNSRSSKAAAAGASRGGLGRARRSAIRTPSSIGSATRRRWSTAGRLTRHARCCWRSPPRPARRLRRGTCSRASSSAPAGPRPPSRPRGASIQIDPVRSRAVPWRWPRFVRRAWTIAASISALEPRIVATSADDVASGAYAEMASRLADAWLRLGKHEAARGCRDRRRATARAKDDRVLLRSGRDLRARRPVRPCRKIVS